MHEVLQPTNKKFSYIYVLYIASSITQEISSIIPNASNTMVKTVF